jgi:hypothetical protein
MTEELSHCVDACFHSDVNELFEHTDFC